MDIFISQNTVEQEINEKLGKLTKFQTELNTLIATMNTHEDAIATISDLGLNEILDMKKKYEKVPYCPLCHYTNFIKRWDDDIIKFNRCPICEKSFDYMEDGMVKSFRASIMGNSEIVDDDRRNLNQKIADKQNAIKNIENEIKVDNVKLQGIRKSIQTMSTQKMETIKSRYTGIKNGMRTLKDLIRMKSSSLTEKKSTLLSFSTNLSKIQSEKTRIQNNIYELEKDISDWQKKLSLIEKELIALNLENNKKISIQDLLKFISNKSKEMLDFELRVDYNELRIMEPTGESRWFQACSASEKIFLEIIMRILVWLYLIEQKGIVKGFLVLDCVDLFLDEKHKNLIKNIFAQTKDKICYIIMTPNKDFDSPIFNNLQIDNLNPPFSNISKYVKILKTDSKVDRNLRNGID